MNTLTKLILTAASKQIPLPPTRDEFIFQHQKFFTPHDLLMLEKAKQKRIRKLKKCQS